MKLKNILAAALVFCSLSMPLASAEVLPQKSHTIGRDLILPQVQLDKKLMKKADEDIKQVVNSFKMMHSGMEHVSIDYTVISDNYEYVSILLHGLAYNEGMPHPGKESHAVVISKKTGRALPVKAFVKLPKLENLKDRVKADDCKVVFVDRTTELSDDYAMRLKYMPEEYIIDDAACVYLLLTEKASYAVDTPLLKLCVDRCQDMYLVKG